MTLYENLELLEPSTREQWSAWLAANHAASKGVRLAIGKKGNPVSTLYYEDAVLEALRYGWIDSTTQKLDEHRYQVLMTPRKPTSVWSVSNKERVERLTAAGLMEPPGQAAVDAAVANGSWNSLDEIDALTVPPELAAALDETPGAAAFFAGLSDSAKRQALYWIGSAKRPETRANRIAEVVSAAADGRRRI